MSYILILAEKPDAARRISESIADSKPRIVRRNGADYYEFTINKKKHVCVPAVGHLFVLNPKKNSDIKGWDYPVFDMEWIPTYSRKGTEWTEKYFRNIQELSKGATGFIDAADVDAEGEVLLYNILRFICNASDAKRMKFSTLTKDELIESYKKMESHIMFSLAESGLTRHHLDALYGLNLTRALTLALKSVNKGFMILSTGRVQGPMLSMLLERELEIRNFKPMPFWQLELYVNIEGQDVAATYEEERIWKKEDAEKIFNGSKGKDAVVKDIKKREYSQYPPPPFNTTDLQSEAYSQFKFSPSQTMSIAESLYQAGYISYPRSSSQKLPPSVGYQKILKAIANLQPYRKFVEHLMKKKILKPVEGPRDDPAHPSVYATHETPDLKKLTLQQKKIYDLIVRRTMATFGDVATRETNTISLDVNGNGFVLVGKKTINPGWMTIYEPYMDMDELILPELKIEQVLKVIKLDMLSKETQPPGRYSQGSIVKEMEKRNLGTKATRADILQTLYDRDYITGKSIQVTKLGEAVAYALKEYCPKIVSEELTRHFDDEMEQVFNGDKDREGVVKEAENVLADILEEFKLKEKQIGEKLAGGLVESRRLSNLIGTCPNCKTGELRMLFSKKSGKKFVGCSNYGTEIKCTTTFPIPLKGQITPLNKACNDCSMPTIQVWRKGSRPFRMCINPACKSKENWRKKT
ncbi:MAG: DNA topoisomerase I [Candidatus Aenigmarchaeota archaeon]|nr:DNA topoisomerase I [Candidatus Aenigmarchaeota archaeon]